MWMGMSSSPLVSPLVRKWSLSGIAQRAQHGPLKACAVRSYCHARHAGPNSQQVGGVAGGGRLAPPHRQELLSCRQLFLRKWSGVAMLESRGRLIHGSEMTRVHAVASTAHISEADGRVACLSALQHCHPLRAAQSRATPHCTAGGCAPPRTSVQLAAGSCCRGRPSMGASSTTMPTS